MTHFPDGVGFGSENSAVSVTLTVGDEDDIGGDLGVSQTARAL